MYFQTPFRDFGQTALNHLTLTEWFVLFWWFVKSQVKQYFSWNNISSTIYYLLEMEGLW